MEHIYWTTGYSSKNVQIPVLMDCYTQDSFFLGQEYGFRYELGMLLHAQEALAYTRMP